MAEEVKKIKKAGKPEKKPQHRDIGIDVRPPAKVCDDPNCPFHGTLSVRGQMFQGKVKTAKMNGSVVVELERLHYVKKYERYEKRFKRISAHLPECMEAKPGDEVKIMECRPLSKTVSFVVVEVNS